MRYPEIVSTSFYHVYNRGVDKRSIFEETSDYQRFIESIFLFNNKNFRQKCGNINKRKSTIERYIFSENRKPLIQIISYGLLCNHFHMLVKQCEPGGIAKFFQKLEAGYTKYFNYKYRRTGCLFDGPYKAKPIDYDEHLQLMPRYIHLNALDGSGVKWRTKKITNWNKAKEILNAFKWSSHHVFAGKTQSLPIIDDTEIKRMFPDINRYWDYLKNQVNDFSCPVFSF